MKKGRGSSPRNPPFLQSHVSIANRVLFLVCLIPVLWYIFDHFHSNYNENNSSVYFVIKILPSFLLPTKHRLSWFLPHAYMVRSTPLSPLAFNLFIVCQCQEVQIKLVKDLLHSYSLMIIYLAVLCNPVIDKHSINLLRDKSTLVLFLPAIRFSGDCLQQPACQLIINYGSSLPILIDISSAL